jgi:hypothetical protein
VSLGAIGVSRPRRRLLVSEPSRENIMDAILAASAVLAVLSSIGVAIRIENHLHR